MSDAIPEIQSAYLNMGTAVRDIESAKGKWESDNWDDAIMWIGFAIEQLESARAKIEREKQKQERGKQ
jgi:hypothetical protein